MTAACLDETTEFWADLVRGCRVEADTVWCRGESAPAAGNATRALTTLLYQRVYLGRARTPTGTTGAAADELTHRLAQADGGRWTWQPGWRPFGAGLVERDGLVVRVSGDEVRPDHWTGLLQVRFPTARPAASPGFFLVTGRAGATPPGRIARFYGNVPAAAAADVLSGVVGGLDERSLPFTFKVLRDPADYPRPDAAVLYCARDDAAAALAVFRKAAGLRIDPDAPTPAFTRRLGPGLAVADDPRTTGAPVSFGQHRCGVVAKALAGCAADATAQQRLTAVHAAFADAGIDVAATHLNPGEPDFDLEDRCAS